jgi:hypothetical protein
LSGLIDGSCRDLDPVRVAPQGLGGDEVDPVDYPCLEATKRRPYGLYVHGNNDTTGAIKAVERITTGLEWKLAHEPVTVIGQVDKAATEACWELGAAMAATLMLEG